jgi:hypothetical protein
MADGAPASYDARVGITVRNPTHDGVCACCGQAYRYFSGEVEFRGGRPLFLAELRTDGGDRTAWMAFVFGPWHKGDGSGGAWVSVRAHRVGDEDLGCAITDAGESPMQDHELLRRLHGLSRADVFARPGAPEYFFDVGDQVLHDREVLTFLKGAHAHVVVV